MIISSNNNKVKKLVTFLPIFNFDQPYGIHYFFNTTHSTNIRACGVVGSALP